MKDNSKRKERNVEKFSQKSKKKAKKLTNAKEKGLLTSPSAVAQWLERTTVTP